MTRSWFMQFIIHGTQDSSLRPDRLATYRAAQLLVLSAASVLVSLGWPASSAAQQDDRSTTSFTLEQLRQGLETTWNAIQNRHVRIAQTHGSSAPDDPDRTLIDVTRTADGKYLEVSQYFRNGREVRVEITAFDGQEITEIHDRRDGTVFEFEVKIAPRVPNRD